MAEDQGGNTRAEGDGEASQADRIRPFMWKKGQSGNPGGRPKNESITAKLRRVLESEHNGREIADLIAERLVREALSGKFAFLKELLDRTEGQALAKHAVSLPSLEEVCAAMSDRDYIALARKHNRLDLLPPALREKAAQEEDDSTQGGSSGT